MRDIDSVEVFCSYSHKDEQYRREFEAHVSLMKRQNLIQIWQDRKILGGGDWAGEIDAHLNTANIITLFVSADFLASDYCYDKEMMRAMDRHAREHVPVVPIIIRQCDWHDAPFGKLQAIPTDGKPVSSWNNSDEAWTEVAKLFKLTVKVVLERIHDKAAAELNTARTKSPGSRVYRHGVEVISDVTEKIASIDVDVITGADQRRLAQYAKWYEYVKSV